MDFDLNEQQKMIRESARKVFATECPMKTVREMANNKLGYLPDLWQQMVALGWVGLPFPEEYGGLEGTFLDLAVLLEEIGRACIPSPFFPTVVLGGMTLLDAGNEEQKQELLPKISKDGLVFTLALTEPSAAYTPDAVQTKAVGNKDEYVIDGVKLFVQDAHVADYIICVARTGDTKKGITLFIVEAKTPGLFCEPLDTVMGGKQCELVFNKVRVPRERILGELDQGWAHMENTLRSAAVAQCVQMTGAVQRVLDMTVQYAKEREQFGRPIGSFQAVQHFCADMAIDVSGCRFLTNKAAWKISKGLPSNMDVAMAKAWLSDTATKITFKAHQIHGAIGYAEEYDLHLYTKLAKSGEVFFGDADFHREIVAQELGI